MVKTKVNTPSDIVERNLSLTGEIMRYLLNNPGVFNSLPDDDPDIRLYNLDLLDQYGNEGKPIVFARIKSKPTPISDHISPRLFVPVPLMEQVGAAVA